jgi:hypothetical protein
MAEVVDSGSDVMRAGIDGARVCGGVRGGVTYAAGPGRDGGVR